MYLKETPDGPFVTLVSFFRVVASPCGRGHALILLEAPLLHRSLPEALNVCVTDNDPLARYLVSRERKTLRPVLAPEATPLMPLNDVRLLATPMIRATFREMSSTRPRMPLSR